VEEEEEENEVMTREKALGVELETVAREEGFRR
jgi:hypothetical protein